MPQLDSLWIWQALDISVDSSKKTLGVRLVYLGLYGGHIWENGKEHGNVYNGLYTEYSFVGLRACSEPRFHKTEGNLLQAVERNRSFS